MNGALAVYVLLEVSQSEEAPLHFGPDEILGSNSMGSCIERVAVIKSRGDQTKLWEER